MPANDSVLDLAKLTLRDGSAVSLRPIKLADETNLLALFKSLSTESRKLRFFTAAPNLTRTAHDECTLDPSTGFGLVATRDGDASIIGHASYRVLEPGCAELDFAIADRFQGLGLATLLLRLRDFLPPAASVVNPVDMIATATASNTAARLPRWRTIRVSTLSSCSSSLRWPGTPTMLKGRCSTLPESRNGGNRCWL